MGHIAFVYHVTNTSHKGIKTYYRLKGNNVRGFNGTTSAKDLTELGSTIEKLLVDEPDLKFTNKLPFQEPGNPLPNQVHFEYQDYSNKYRALIPSEIPQTHKHLFS